MSKKILAKLKKLLIALLVIAILAGVVVALRAIFAGRGNRVDFVETVEHTVIPNESLKQLSGQGYTMVAENDALSLLVSFDDGNIQVINKENGYVWRSCPTEEEMALETSNDLWKSNLISPIMFTYVNDYSSMDNKFGNVANQNTKITVFALPMGARVYFEFTLSGITMAYDITLNDDHISVVIPPYLISDPGEVMTVGTGGVEAVDKANTFILTDFILFPSLGATMGKMNIDGYFFVPDGTGALMRFDSDKNIRGQFAGHVYGADFSLYGSYDSTMQTEMNKPSISYPVFGLVREGNSMMAVIDRGETQADIIASKAGAQTQFHSIYTRFTYRMKYKVMTNIATKAGYMSYTRFHVDEERQINYYFDCGDRADYVGMAQTYRGYLMDKYGLNKMDPTTEPPALQLNIVGSDLKDTMIGTSYIAMTTFEQAKEILQYFKDNGVENLDAVYRGWARFGESVELPYRFPVPSALGGQKKLTELAAYAKDLGYRLYLQDDNSFLSTSRGLSLRNDTIYNIQDSPLSAYGSGTYYATPSFTQKMFEQNYEKYQAMGINGLEEEGLSWLLVSNYNNNAAITREQMKQANLETLQNMLEKFGSLRLDNDFVYSLADNVVLTYLRGSSYLSLLDESVPFYPIALHGLVEYVNGDYNDEYYEPKREMLKAIERGANVSFTVSYEPTENLRDSQWSYYFSTEFVKWREEILARYSRLEEYLGATRGQFIVGHRQVAKNVVCVTYENGVEVVVNYGQTPYTYQGTKVGAEDFALIGGRK